MNGGYSVGTGGIKDQYFDGGELDKFGKEKIVQISSKLSILHIISSLLKKPLYLMTLCFKFQLWIICLPFCTVKSIWRNINRIFLTSINNEESNITGLQNECLDLHPAYPNYLQQSNEQPAQDKDFKNMELSLTSMSETVESLFIILSNDLPTAEKNRSFDQLKKKLEEQEKEFCDKKDKFFDEELETKKSSVTDQPELLPVYEPK